jgi:hypothetical protein
MHALAWFAAPPPKSVCDATNLMTRANVGVGANERAGEAATHLKCVAVIYSVCAAGLRGDGRLRLRRPAHMVVLLG